MPQYLPPVEMMDSVDLVEFDLEPTLPLNHICTESFLRIETCGAPNGNLPVFSDIGEPTTELEVLFPRNVSTRYLLSRLDVR